MSETFYGPWSVALEQMDAVSEHRFVISGAEVGAGVHDPGVIGTVVKVAGSEWNLRIEWNGGTGWQESDIQRTATYTALDGLVVALGGDDGPPATADRDFNDMVLIARPDDPTLDPLRPERGNPYDFSVPDDRIVHKEHLPDR